MKTETRELIHAAARAARAQASADQSVPLAKVASVAFAAAVDTAIDQTMQRTRVEDAFDALNMVIGELDHMLRSNGYWAPEVFAEWLKSMGTVVKTAQNGLLTWRAEQEDEEDDGDDEQRGELEAAARRGDAGDGAVDQGSVGEGPGRAGPARGGPDGEGSGG